MKAAFASQYNRRFVSAGVESTKYTHPELLGANTSKQSNADQNFNMPPPPLPSGTDDTASTSQVKRRRSRWD